MSDLQNLIGPLVSDDHKLRARMRFHQGWWRAFVLSLPPGPRKGSTSKLVCSTIPMPEPGSASVNFLTPAISAAAEATVASRGSDSAGIVDGQRLRTNLLSSQPLVFNFFAPLQQDLNLATRVLPRLFGLGEAEVTAIHFEYAHEKRPIDDNTAFDVAIEYRLGDRRGLVGIECKYTEPFSKEAYDRPRYRTVYDQSRAVFATSYEQLTQSRYNQLFRTHLLAQALRLSKAFSEVHTCLFHSELDESSATIGAEFGGMLMAATGSRFATMTFARFISAVQREELTWDEREWTMLLWARYCGLQLSDRASHPA